MRIRNGLCKAGTLCAWLAVALLGISGCNTPLLRDEPIPTKPVVSAIDPESVQFVRTLTRPWGLNAQGIQGVSLVVGLAGTGSDPNPTAERSMLLSEMQTRNVERPSEVLSASSTALVLVRGQILPGARKGDRYDLEVRVPSGSETTSLLGGWMMQSRLREYAKLDQRLASGHVLGHGNGHVLIDALLESDDDSLLKTRGRILGGGIVAKPRNLGLVMRDEFTSVKASTQVGRAINQRFHIFDRGNKEGVAKPKRDNFIELRVHPRYRDNLIRYVRVIQNIAVRESPMALTQRLELLRAQLLNPASSSLAAVQLEAIGEPGLSVLEDGIESDDAEVQFYAAEALAYLNHPPAGEILDSAARDEPAFRWRAITALGAMDDIAAHEALISLMHVESAETRYGAFRILRQLTPDDPVIRGTVMGEKFLMHIVESTGPPLVHVAKTERPEIVLFGAQHTLRPPVVLFAGAAIVVRSESNGQVRIRKLSAGEEDDELLVAADLKSVIRGIVEMGGTYADVVQALSEAKRAGTLESRLEFSALPETGRVYHRDQSEPPLLDEFTSEEEADGFVFDSAPVGAGVVGPKQPRAMSELESRQDAMLNQPLSNPSANAVEFDGAGQPTSATPDQSESQQFASALARDVPLAQQVVASAELPVSPSESQAELPANLQAVESVEAVAPIVTRQATHNARQPARLNEYSAAPSGIPLAARSEPQPLAFAPQPGAGSTKNQPPEPTEADVPEVEFAEYQLPDENVLWDDSRRSAP